MTKYLTVGLSLALLLFIGSPAFSAGVPDNLVTNGGFEAGAQIWRGDGKVVLLPDGNRVYEIEASKSRMKDLKQEFHLRQLQQVEVLFRAKSLKYTGPGLRIAIHQLGKGSMLWNKDLPDDGTWHEFRVVYTRTAADNDMRELNIAVLLGSGSVQIDDVEVREPSKLAENQPTTPPSSPSPPSSAIPATPAPKSLPPLAIAKPPAPNIPAPQALPAPPTPAAKQPPLPSVPPGTFGSMEQIMNSAPTEIMQKVQNKDTADAGLNELDDYFRKNVKGKPVQVHLNIDNLNPKASTDKAYLVHAVDTPATMWIGAPLTAYLWIKFSDPTPSAAEKLANGTDPVISGVIIRCETGRVGKLHLNLDIGQAKIESP